jgi:hypothetical protein
MSLINDVLRQVDANASSKSGIVSILPAATIYADGNKNISRFLFASVSSLLLLILVLQLVLDKPLSSIFIKSSSYADAPLQQYQPVGIVPTTKTDPMLILNTQNVGLPVNTFLVKEPLAAIEEPLVIAPKLVIAAKPKVSIKPKPKPKLNAKNIAVKTLAVQPIPERSISQPVTARGSVVGESVTVSSQPAVEGEKEYQDALRFFINENIPAADQFIKLALKKNSLEKYYSLQARIYIKQKDSAGFYALVKDNPGNTSLDWFKLIAPGLQLFSYYQLSNKYYYSLIKIEPEQIRWQLAIALNYQRLGDSEKAISTYHQLYQSERASNQQKQWLMKKIKRLSDNKV